MQLYIFVTQVFSAGVLECKSVSVANLKEFFEMKANSILNEQPSQQKRLLCRKNKNESNKRCESRPAESESGESPFPLNYELLKINNAIPRESMKSKSSISPPHESNNSNELEFNKSEPFRSQESLYNEPLTPIDCSKIKQSIYEEEISKVTDLNLVANTLKSDAVKTELDCIFVDNPERDYLENAEVASKSNPYVNYDSEFSSSSSSESSSSSSSESGEHSLHECNPIAQQVHFDEASGSQLPSLSTPESIDGTPNNIKVSEVITVDGKKKVKKSWWKKLRNRVRRIKKN